MKIKIACLLLAFSLPGFTQDTPGQQKKPEPKASSESSSAEQKPKLVKPKNKTKIFVPSEEISEDLPVSFPVDI